MSADELKKELPLPGELINVSGRKIHVQRRGTGSPTVVFESGVTGTTLQFAKVQPEISRITSTLSYDRAGLGYSEKSPNPKRISSVIASELFELLNALDLHEPLVLVGASAGGIYIREFAQQHPEMVAGMVFIDSAHESQNNRYPEEIALYLKRENDQQIELFTRLSKMTHEELLKELPDPLPWQNFHPDTHKYFEDLERPEMFEYYLELLSFFEEDTDQSWEALKSLRNIPLVVISRSKANFSGLNEEQNKLATELRNNLQNELAGLSTSSRHIKVDSGHNIANEKPEIVIKAIKELVERVREKK